jgi:acetyl-CoA acetyltransferase family protein
VAALSRIKECTVSEAVIVAAARTPIGRAFKGSLVDVSAFRLAEVAIREAVARSGIDHADIDDIVLGESLYGGGDIARHTAVVLGLTNVPGLADNRHCASGLSALQLAAGSIGAGMDDVVVAGGTQSSSSMPQTWMVVQPGGEPESWLSPSHPDTPEAPNRDMSITVGENTSREMGLTRRDLDEWAAYSQQQAIASIDAGWFVDEIVPVEYTDREGNQQVFSVDEHPRRGITVESLSELKPLHPELESPTITAGNASGINDGAAALVIASEEKARELGVEPLGAFLGSAVAGVDPRVMGIGPIPAVQKLLGRTGIEVGQLDLVELNEAFASQSLAVVRELGLDPAIVNVNGGAIAIGHPLGMSGARLVVSLLHELRRRGGRYGLATLCVGVGQGQAALFERP